MGRRAGVGVPPGNGSGADVAAERSLRFLRRRAESLADSGGEAGSGGAEFLGAAEELLDNRASLADGAFHSLRLWHSDSDTLLQVDEREPLRMEGIRANLTGAPASGPSQTRPSSAASADWPWVELRR